MRKSSHSRNAFTLLELLLVCFLIVILAALAFPSIRSAYRGVRVDSGVDTVREALATARLRATEEGRSYRVAIRPGQRNIRVAPNSPEFWDGQNPQGTDPETGVRPLIMEKELPEDLRLYVVGEAMPTPELDEVTSAEFSPTEWQKTVVFFPDGRASGIKGEDVSILVRFDEAKLGAVVSVRGLTGARSARKATEEELP